MIEVFIDEMYIFFNCTDDENLVILQELLSFLPGVLENMYTLVLR